MNENNKINIQYYVILELEAFLKRRKRNKRNKTRQTYRILKCEDKTKIKKNKLTKKKLFF